MKTNVLIFLSILSLIFGAIIFNSCQKEELFTYENNMQLKSAAKQKRTIYVKDGILHLSNNAVKETQNMLSNMSETEFRQWEKKMNFISLRTIANNIHDDLERAKSKEEYLEIVEKNSDIFAIENNTLVLKIDDDKITSVCNREGIYYVDKSMFKVTPEYIFSSRNVDLRNIDNNLTSSNNNIRVRKWNTNLYESTLKSTAVPNSSSQIIIPSPTLKFASEGPTSPTCSSGYSGDWDDAQRSDGKRKVKVWMNLILKEWPDEDDWEQKYAVRITVRGYKKKFGIYDWYKTNLSFEDANFKVSAPYVWDELIPAYDESGYYWKNYYMSNWSGSENDTEKLEDEKEVGNTEVINCEEELPNVHSLCKFRVKATSRGVGDKWATICHGYSCCGSGGYN